jgi:hypothetical protein
MLLAALRHRWAALFGTEPPRAYRPEQLVRRLAYRVQELHYGGLSQAAQRKLAEIADRDEQRRKGRRPSRQMREMPAAGTRFVREWHGQEHVVTATPDGGFEYAGRRYRTLTAVAEAITGQHMSGRRFFGLYRQEGRRKHDPVGQSN